MKLNMNFGIGNDYFIEEAIKHEQKASIYLCYGWNFGIFFD